MLMVSMHHEINRLLLALRKHNLKVLSLTLLKPLQDFKSEQKTLLLYRHFSSVGLNAYVGALTILRNMK